MPRPAASKAMARSQSQPQSQAAFTRAPAPKAGLKDFNSLLCLSHLLICITFCIYKSFHQDQCPSPVSLPNPQSRNMTTRACGKKPGPRPPGYMQICYHCGDRCKGCIPCIICGHLIEPDCPEACVSNTGADGAQPGYYAQKTGYHTTGHH